MNRRSAITSSGTLLLATLTGCLDGTIALDGNDDNSDQTNGENNDENGGLTQTEKYAIECERHYLKTEGISENADSLSYQALVTNTEDRSVGKFITLLVDFATSMQREDEPVAVADGEYQVYYHISDTHDSAYRTEEADEDPRDGIKVDC